VLKCKCGAPATAATPSGQHAYCDAHRANVRTHLVELPEAPRETPVDLAIRRLRDLADRLRITSADTDDLAAAQVYEAARIALLRTADNACDWAARTANAPKEDS
jgi:hypothetical protein